MPTNLLHHGTQNRIQKTSRNMAARKGPRLYCMSRVSRSGCAWTRSVRTRSVRTRSRRTRSDRTRSGRTRSCTDKGCQDKVAWELQVKVPKLAQVEVNLKRTAKSVLYPKNTGENASGAWLGTSVACVCQIMFWLHSTVCFIFLWVLFQVTNGC